MYVSISFCKHDTLQDKSYQIVCRICNMNNNTTYLLQVTQKPHKYNK